MDELNATPASVPAPGDWGSRDHVKTLILMFITAVGVYLCYQMVVPFLAVIAWALALAVLFAPLQQWLESKLKHANLAALVSVFMIGVLVVVPVIFVGEHLIFQAAKGAEIVEARISSGDWLRAFQAQPALADYAARLEQATDLSGSMKPLTSWLSTMAGSLVKGSVFQVTIFCLTFYLLFFFLRDRREALHAIRLLSPLSHDEMTRLYVRVSDTIYATVYGTLAVAGLQGMLGGLMFWWLGLSAPLLWGLVMALLAVVPVLGAFVVWVPAALFLVMEGSWGKALILTLWGVFIVGTVDNLLRPVLVGNRLKLHTVLAFVSVVGGLLMFGPAGLIIGPVALTVTTVLLECWHTRLHPSIQ